MEVYDDRKHALDWLIHARPDPTIRSRHADDAICRTPIQGERQCGNGTECQGFLTLGDVLVEMGGDHGCLCLRCTRHVITTKFLKMRATNQNVSEAAEPITSFYNIVGKEGEYHVAQALTTSDSKYQGLLMGVMPEYSTFYTRHIEGDVVYHVQTMYRFPDTGTFMYPKKVELTPSVVLDNMAGALFNPGHIYIWNPLNMDGPQQLWHRKYCDLVVRLDDSEKCIVNTGGNRRANQMQQDLLLPISIQMETNNSFSDEEIGAVNEGKGLLIFEEDVLPEASTHLLNCSIWDTVKVMDNEMDADFVAILTSCFPKMSKEREFVELLVEKIKNQNREFGDLIFRILIGGLLGVYESCKITANFRRRRAIYNWYYFKRIDLADWMTTNQTIVTFLFREYLFRSIRKVAPLYDFLCDIYPWKSNEVRIFEACDRIRDDYNHTALESLSREDYQLAEFSIEKTLGRSNWKGFPKFPITSKTETIVASISAISKNNMFDQKKELSVCPNNEIWLTREFVWKYAMCLSETDLDWMESLFQIPKDAVLVDAINGINIAKPKVLEQAVASVFRRSQREFAVLKTFYTVLDQERTLSVYKLPNFIVAKQKSAYLKLYTTTTLPSHAGDYYYCRNCGSVKTVIPKKNTNNDPVSLSHTKTIYDLATHSTYCRSAKERPDVSRDNNDGDEVSKKVFRANLKKEQISPCIEEKLSHINLIGKAVTTKLQGTIIVCPGCGLLATLGKDAVNCGDSFLTCGCSFIKITRC